MSRQLTPVDDLSPKISPRSSPRKVTPSPTSTMERHNKTNNNTKETLSNLFDSSNTDMSTFRVLYNLEVSLMQLIEHSQMSVKMDL